jgi:hypothetical protein
MIHSIKTLWIKCHYAVCRYTDCHYAECRYAECHYAECRYDECRNALEKAFSVISTIFKSQLPNPNHFTLVAIMEKLG